MSTGHRPQLILQPSVKTTKVVTTTTTTTTYAPIQLPPLPSSTAPKDLKNYPLYNAKLPLRQFPITFPDGKRATFRDGEVADDEPLPESEIASGSGWRMLRQDEVEGGTPVVGLAEAVERFSRKRTHGNESEDVMEGIETMASPAPPRKKARPTQIPPIVPAAPPSPLPSPRGSPPPGNPEQSWPSAPPSGASSPQPQMPFQPDMSMTTLLALPTLLSQFINLPPDLQSYFVLELLRQSSLPVLRTVHAVLTPTLARDFLTLLPPELVSHILSYLPFSTLARASRVSKTWRDIIDSDPVLWRDLLKSKGIWFGGESEKAFTNALEARYKRQARLHPEISRQPQPHPYKTLFKSRHLTRTRWITNANPKHISFPAHGSSVVTCLLFSHGRIISASDDHSIHVYDPLTGELIRALDGHEGGVWALAATKDTLVSGSTDRTVRIWDLTTGRCTHVFGGHTSTVRCLAIVKPEVIDVEDEDGVVHRERWPKSPLIVTGSRDHSLRVWSLPRPGAPEFRCYGAEDADVDPGEVCDADDNPYHRLHLEGHEHAVRALAARGRTLVSGSYDCNVRIWDTITGECQWTLKGHTQKGWSPACSGSMDGTVKVWDLRTGACLHTLTGHTSLVGLLGLSPSYLVSAAADSTLRIWDSDTGTLRHTLQAHTGAITCFQHDEFKVLSGSDGTLKMWSMRDGSHVRDLLTDIMGVWQVVFEGRWCVAASNRQDQTMLDVWDFGLEGDDGWIGEPPGGVYDDADTDAEYDDDDGDDLSLPPKNMEEEEDENGEAGYYDDEDESMDAVDFNSATSVTMSERHRRVRSAYRRAMTVESEETQREGGGMSGYDSMGLEYPDASMAHSPPPRHHRGPLVLPSNDETPTRPRIMKSYPGGRKRPWL
ncbi:WD40 repeat-like protein [Fistulina hepatica ATCC 64428]|uniref:WD40 repeat-like protein n=1 Tax=Fistulina hepatica ATCC 64428 TaxID=1128425 RepID=A0A0D6ZZG7_9AGAR|nr:WD40 repeat-like protein [Fistulina hepatica ATCC 64428]